MNKNIQRPVYFLYARKSSEDKGRQVQSIPDQIKEMKEVASTKKLRILEVIEEAKSAKEPYVRPKFDKMLERIKKGEANGILCWELDRLSRNQVDAGNLGHLLLKGIIASIQTHEKEYLPEDNVILFNLMMSMATQYSIDLKIKVKRGTASKLDKGWAPYRPKPGYFNDKNTRTIEIDRERFDLVRKMWDLMLTGKYTPPQILRIANEEWGFRTRITEKTGGKELSRSVIYYIFRSIFYTGLFDYDGKVYNGRHQPMITLDEYDRVQELLGKKGNPRSKKLEFIFKGPMKCGECGGSVTAETQKKHNYYHCTRNKKGMVCSQKKYVTEVQLEQQIVEIMSKYTIHPKFRQWALEVLNEVNDKEIQERQAIFETQQRTLASCQRQLDNLTKMRYRELIDEPEFIKEKTNLQNELLVLKAKRNDTEMRAQNWLELTERAFNFACYSKEVFEKGDIEAKKEIFVALGSNYRLLDGKLHIEPSPWLVPIEKEYKAMEEEYMKFEPAISLDVKGINEVLAPLRIQWLDVLSFMRTQDF